MAYGNITEFIKGQIALNSYDQQIDNRAAYNQINFGEPVFGYIGDETYCSTIKRDTCSLEFDGDFVTSNVITITVNGTAAAAVTFATDHDTTADLVVDAINALTCVECVLDSSDTDNRTFLIRTKYADITVTEAVTGGGGQVTGTASYSTDMVFLGVAVHTQQEQLSTSSPVSYYEANDAVPIMSRGNIVIETSKAVNALDDAYVIETGTNQKLFTDSTSDSVSVNSKFQDTISAAGLAKLRVNGQYKPNSEIAWS